MTFQEKALQNAAKALAALANKKPGTVKLPAFRVA